MGCLFLLIEEYNIEFHGVSILIQIRFVIVEACQNATKEILPPIVVKLVQRSISHWKNDAHTFMPELGFEPGSFVLQAEM